MELHPTLEALGSSLFGLVDKVIGPFLGSLLGALSAFQLERYRVQSAQRRERIAALNRAKFILSEIRSALTTLQVRHLDPKKDDPERWRQLSPLAVAGNRLDLDLGPLVFLVDQDREDLLKDIFSCCIGYQAVITALQERRLAMERLWDTVSAVRREHPDIATHDEIDQMVGPAVTSPLKGLTNALYESVADVLPLVMRTETAVQVVVDEYRRK